MDRIRRGSPETDLNERQASFFTVRLSERGRCLISGVLAWIGLGLRHPVLRPGVADSGVQLLEGALARRHFVTTSGHLATAAAFVLRYREEHDGEPGNTAAAGFGAIDLLAKAPAVRWHRMVRSPMRPYATTSSRLPPRPPSVHPAGQPGRGGSQRLVVRLQLQWQDDGEAGLVQRVIYPDGGAEAEPSTTAPAPSR